MTDIKQYQELEDQIREVVRVPDPNPEFAAHLRGRLASLSVTPARPRFRLNLAWGLGIALAVLVIAASLPGAASAIRQLFGFIPGIGPVEQGTAQKVLEAPVMVTRDGVTLTIEQVIAYDDRVELSYRVDGLPAGQEPTGADACGGPDMYPVLSLPDGSQVPAEPMALGGEMLAAGYRMGHGFDAAFPAEASGATFHLKCLQNAQPGAAPEDWAVPFQLAAAPTDQPVGKLLEPGNAPVVVEPAGVDTSFTFLGGALHDDGYHFFFRFSAADTAPDFMTARPAAMYLIDSSGQRVDLINTLPWSPFEAVDIWEYRAAMPPAPGPVTVHIDGVAVYYLGQAAAFEFAPGEDAQVGQTWVLDERFTIGGHDLTVSSAEMVELEGHRGFDFTIEAGDPDLKFTAELLDVHSFDQGFEMWSTTSMPAPASAITTGFVYESAVPPMLAATFNTITVTEPGAWIVEWTPPQP